MARFALVAGLVLAVVVATLAADTIERESNKRHVYPVENAVGASYPAWRLMDEFVGSTESVSFRLYLKQRNLAVLERELLRRSDPRNAEYGMLLLH
jgi:hypothetical protein